MAVTAMCGNFLAWQNPFPHMVIHHATHKFLVLPREKLHGSTLKIPHVCEVINGLYCMNTVSVSVYVAVFHFC